ncbi:SET and MYND domain-containing protein 5 [Chamberlinius hualienensis]
MAECLDDEGVEVRHIDNFKGKGLFAKKSFQCGDIIFEERPLVCCQFLWNAMYGYAACDYCMKSLETAEENVRRLLGGKSDVSLPYPECCETKKESQVSCPECNIKYCNEECRKSGLEQYHKVLCMGSFNGDRNHPLENLQEAWRNMHYPPETSNIMLLARIIATVIQAEDKEGAMNLFKQFCHRTVNEVDEIAHKLLGEKFRDQMEQLRQLMMKALPCDECAEWYTPHGFQSLVALVGTNAQGVGTSPLCHWVKNCEELEIDEEERNRLDDFINQLYQDIDEESGGFLNNEGSALYSLHSACNHSCVPNAEPNFPYDNFKLSMVATEDIPEGIEICISYLDECTRNRSRHSRSKILRENYLFTCNCPKCTEQLVDPDVTSEEEIDEDESEKENGTDTVMDEH